MQLLQCISLALAIVSAGSAISLVSTAPSAHASAATIRRATHSTTSAAITPSALDRSERAAEPASFGAVPLTATAKGTHAYEQIPAWLRQATPAPYDQRTDGVLLGPSSLFPALGNDQGIGDCTVAAVRDVVIAAALRSRHGAKRTTTTEAVAAWENLNGGTSNGVSDLSVMDAWSSSSGILGSTIAGWGSLDVNSSRKIKQAVASTGSIYATLNVPEMISWSRLVWSIPTNSSTPLTDHAVALIGWVRQGWIAVSWGEIVLIPWSDWRVEAIGTYVVSPSLIH